MMKTTSWYKCHKEGWRQDLVPEAYSHPAKVNRGLARKIYAYVLEQGWLKEGDVCLDPFAGICGFALDAMFHGLHFIGCELEEKFVQLGQQNIDLWNRRYGGGKLRRWGTATILQGDSRNLIEVLEGARAEGLISSPPWSSVQIYDDKNFTTIDSRPRYRGTRWEFRPVSEETASAQDGYGTDPAQLGNMPTGEPPPQCILSSPPYATQTVHDRCDIDPDKLTGNPPGLHSQALTMANYGDTEGQLGTMPTGEPPQAVIGSPPHSVNIKCDHTCEQRDKGKQGKGCFRGTYGSKADGQLAAMREGDVDAVIASPPFADSQQSKDADFVLDSTEVNPTPRKLADRSYFPAKMEGDGQLAALPEGEPPQTFLTKGEKDDNVSAPQNMPDLQEGIPLSQPIAQGTEILRPKMPQGSQSPEPPQVDACISSPPIMCSDNRNPSSGTAHKVHGNQTYCDESPTDGRMGGDRTSETARRSQTERAKQVANLGNIVVEGNKGLINTDTFWSAARAILLQCHQVLAPGGVAIFVTKRFIRNKQIVEFSQQWVDLCQSCGFELVEWIKAWLVEERGTQYDLEGEAHTKTVKRFSFFRRLHAQKYPHLAIEWEDVLIFHKPGGEGKEGLAEGIVASPPFSNSDMRKGGSNLAVDKAVRTGRNPNSPSVQSCASANPYGIDPSNLGNMPTGDPPI